MPGVDVEDGRQASWPLNSFDIEIGSSHIDEEPQSVEASKPVPTSPPCSDRLRWIKASLGSAACICVFAAGVVELHSLQEPVHDTIDLDRWRSSPRLCSDTDVDACSFSALQAASGIYFRRWKGAHVKHPARSKIYKVHLATPP